MCRINRRVAPTSINLCLAADRFNRLRPVHRPAVITRWGKEEFVILLPSTDDATALALADDLRVAVAAIRLTGPEGEIVITTSFASHRPWRISREPAAVC